MRWLPILVLAPALAAQTVTGTVTNALTQQPVAGATVFLFGDASVAGRASTDETGAFRFPNVKPGDYSVLATQTGYDVPYLRSVVVHVEADRDPSPLTFALTPFPRLTGRVLDPERNPIAGIPVHAIVIRGLEVPPAVTDKQGRFAFPPLAPGEYELLANPLEAGGSEFAPTYFPASGDRSGGERIAVRPGPDLAGYDIVLRGGQFFNVRGRVLDEAGRPAPGAEVTIQNPDATCCKAVTREDGTFEIEHVPPVDGWASALWKPGATQMRGAAPVAVTKHDLESVELRVSPPAVLRGVVELDGEDVGAAVGTYAQLTPVAGDGTRVSAITSGDGIRFDAYPGRYVLIYVPPRLRDAYLDSVRMGDRDITMQEFELTPGMPPLRIVLRKGGGAVTAKVENAANSTAAAAAGPQVAVLVPQEPRLRCDPFVVRGMLSGSGAWTFSNIRPGDYYAVAADWPMRPADFSDPHFADAMISQGVPVRVEENAIASVTLKWARQP